MYNIGTTRDICIPCTLIENDLTFLSEWNPEVHSSGKVTDHFVEFGTPDNSGVCILNCNECGNSYTMLTLDHFGTEHQSLKGTPFRYTWGLGW